MSGECPWPKFASPYPVRKEFRGIFALHFLRLIHKRGVARQFGSNAVALLMAIVEKEDRFKRPVEFWNAELTDKCGCLEPTMISVRKKLVDSGWLYYSKGAKRRPGVYCVLEPIEFTAENDSESTADGPEFTVGNDSETSEGTSDSLSKTLVNPEINFETSGCISGVIHSCIPNQNSPSSNTDPEKEDWDGLTEKMLKAGIVMALPWTALARSRGFSASVVSGWIDEVQDMVAMGKCKWGVIGARLEKDVVTGSNWLFPGLEEFRLEDKRREAEEHDRIERARKAAELAKAAEEFSSKVRQLELQFGSDVDALSGDELCELIRNDEKLLYAFKMARGDRRSSLVRFTLLERYAATRVSEQPP